MSTWSEHPRRPGRGPVLASVAFHVFLLVAAWWLHRQADSPIEYIAYEMEMVSMAELEEPIDALPEPDEVVQPDPDPVPPQPEPEPEPPPPEPDPEPEPEPPPPEPEPEPDPEPEPSPTQTDTPPREEAPPQEEQAEPSSAEIAVRMEGLRRDYPAYYSTIVREISRCFRAPAGVDRGTTVVRFEIVEDGTVPGSSIQIHQRSGNSRLDIAAVGAVECAGAGRFGALPGDLPFDRLPVQFTFGPGGNPGPGGP